MKLLRDLGFLRSLRGLLSSGRRDAARTPRTITVPAPLSRPNAAALIELRAQEAPMLPLQTETRMPPVQDAQKRPLPADMAAARSAAAARAGRPQEARQRLLQTSRNKVLLSRLA